MTNLSPLREIVISHIWFERAEGQGGPIHIMNPERPLTARFRLDEQYETWIPAADVAGVLDWAARFRVKLTSGDVIRSRLNKSVPPVGDVAGGGESPYSAALSSEEQVGVTGVDPEAFKAWQPGPTETSASASYKPPPDNKNEPA